ncbi:MAG: methyltransferase domain-containing protein, partial [Bacteroidota bacterium]
IQGDIMGMDFDHQFDLILAIGILAHISDPSAFIARIDQLLRPGGTLIIQNTDDQHFVIKVQKLIRQQKQLSQSGLYDMNTIPHEWLMNQFGGLNYRLEQMYRYETKIPFLSSNKDPLSGIWKVFGVPPKNTFSFLGSKCIYKFKKP